MSPLSGVLSEAWELYKRHAAHFLLISFVIYLVVAAVSALLTAAGGTVGAFIGAFLSLFGMFLLQAALVKAVEDVRDGRVDLDLRATVSAAMPTVAPVAIASVLASIGIVIGFALIIVPGLILITFWSLIVPCIVLGGAGAFESFGRSWRTVRGYGWNVFGTIVLVFLIMVVFNIVLSLIFLALPHAARSFISDIVAGTLIAPFIATVTTLAYYRLTGAHEAATPGPYDGGPPVPGLTDQPVPCIPSLWITPLSAATCVTGAGPSAGATRNAPPSAHPNPL
jgi:hypothetical protein